MHLATGRTCHYYLDRRETRKDEFVTTKALEINELGDTMGKRHTPFKDVIERLVSWTDNLSNNAEVIIFVAHNAKSDWEQLKGSCDRRGITFPTKWRFVDSVPMFQSLAPERTYYNLNSLTKWYLGEDEKHWALPDAVHIIDVLRAVARAWVAFHKNGREVDDVVVQVINEAEPVVV